MIYRTAMATSVPFSVVVVVVVVVVVFACIYTWLCPGPSVVKGSRCGRNPVL